MIYLIEDFLIKKHGIPHHSTWASPPNGSETPAQHFRFVCLPLPYGWNGGWRPRSCAVLWQLKEKCGWERQLPSYPLLGALGPGSSSSSPLDHKKANVVWKTLIWSPRRGWGERWGLQESQQSTPGPTEDWEVPDYGWRRWLETREACKASGCSLCLINIHFHVWLYETRIPELNGGCTNPLQPETTLVRGSFRLNTALGISIPRTIVMQRNMGVWRRKAGRGRPQDQAWKIRLPATQRRLALLIPRINSPWSKVSFRE